MSKPIEFDDGGRHVQAIRAKVDRLLATSDAWGVSLADAKILCNALDALAAEVQRMTAERDFNIKRAEQWDARCHDMMAERDAERARTEGQGLHLMTLTAERDALRRQLDEAQAEAKHHSHSADMWMIASSAHERERDEARAQLTDARTALERIAHCDYENGEDVDDITHWARAALAKLGER